MELKVSGRKKDIPLYLVQVAQPGPISAEEESDLIRAIQAGDAEARKRLTEAHMRLVLEISTVYQSHRFPLQELLREGIIGLMQAAERFHPGNGYRFSTYATHWIRQAIGRAIDNRTEAIR